MRPAKLLTFPTEAATPREHPEEWIMCLDYVCPRLDPALAIIREKGKPARTLRMEPEPPPAVHVLGKRLS